MNDTTPEGEGHIHDGETKLHAEEDRSFRLSPVEDRAGLGARPSHGTPGRSP